MNLKIVKNPEEANAITHGGIFHADEVFGTVMLSYLYEEVRLMRTFRVPETTEALVFDIGQGEYDHHQKGRNGERANGIPYAAAGLLWKSFGEEVLKKMGCEERNLSQAWKIVDEKLITSIDAVDNGIQQEYSAYPPFMVSHVIAGFNPTWNSSETPDHAFLRAVDMANVIFQNEVTYAIATAEAENLTHQAIQNSKDHVMVLDRFIPFTESDELYHSDILFTVFPSLRGGFNIRCTPVAKGSMELRHPFPVSWRGQPVEELRKRSGVEDATFVHPNGFMAGAETIDGALKMIQEALHGEESGE